MRSPPHCKPSILLNIVLTYCADVTLMMQHDIVHGVEIVIWAVNASYTAVCKQRAVITVVVFFLIDLLLLSKVDFIMYGRKVMSHCVCRQRWAVSSSEAELCTAAGRQECPDWCDAVCAAAVWRHQRCHVLLHTGLQGGGLFCCALQQYMYPSS